MNELQGRELDRALAEAMGWRLWHVPAHFYPLNDPDRQCRWARVDDANEWVFEGGSLVYPPAYSSSVDALAPVEARLREAGLYLVVRDPAPWSLEPHVIRAEWFKTKPVGALSMGWGEDQDEAPARARACLAALQV